MASDPIEIIRNISSRVYDMKSGGKNVPMNANLRPWQGIDNRVSPDSYDKYFLMDISYFEEDPFTGDSDVVGE